ncbi:hypothetical protein FRX31_007427 [Thalictrum thalictroides]|uniref:Uncharacterized protein n=1 Tax=Thalictrum thalictroides TaxID=46969 RepID=A0A7J6X3N5_THATH|nr:hypothetical protein FRX31_007427 [Thalictrum thalictroides]
MSTGRVNEQATTLSRYPTPQTPSDLLKRQVHCPIQPTLQTLSDLLKRQVHYPTLSNTVKPSDLLKMTLCNTLRPVEDDTLQQPQAC